MEKKFNELDFCLSHHEEEKALYQFISVLLTQKQSMIIKRDIGGIVMVQYNNAEQLGYGDPIPMWIEEDEQIIKSEEEEESKDKAPTYPLDYRNI